jgi:two-component system response regulator FlrC
MGFLPEEPGSGGKTSNCREEGTAPPAPVPVTFAMTILVVDDDPIIRDVIGELLADTPHWIIYAASVPEAERLIIAHNPTLILTDLRIPGRDGFELIYDLKVSKTAVRIVAMSSGGDYLPRDRCLRMALTLGASVILEKPFSQQQLLDAIDRAMALPSDHS